MGIDEVIWKYSNNTGKTNRMFETYVKHTLLCKQASSIWDTGNTHICVRHADNKETSNIGRIHKIC